MKCFVGLADEADPSVVTSTHTSKPPHEAFNGNTARGCKIHGQKQALEGHSSEQGRASIGQTSCVLLEMTTGCDVLGTSAGSSRSTEST